MCDPTGGVIASVAIGAASAAAQADAQNKAAKEQNAYRSRLGVAGNKQYVQNAEAVIQDVGSQVDQIVRQNQHGRGLSRRRRP